MGGDLIQSLQDKVQLLNAEIETLTAGNEHAQTLVTRAEQEKKVAIEQVGDLLPFSTDISLQY